MRTRLWGFVTILGLSGLFGCGTSTGGGGGGGAIYCGIGGACPAGFSCNPNNFCIPGSADAGVTDTGSKSDTGSAGTDAESADTGTAKDSQIDTSKPDIAPVDTFTPDVQTTGTTQTVTEVEQAPSSAACSTPDAIADSASDVTLDLVVVTSPPTKLKGSGTTYFTSFFATSQSGAASDGSWAGIQVIVNADPFAISVGDVVRVKGTVKEFYCMTEITAKPEDVTIYGNDGEPAPYGAQVSLFGTSNAEAFEGDLIKINNVQVQDPNPVSTDGKNHGECTINHNGGADSVNIAPAIGSAYLTAGANGTMTTFSAGQGLLSITGNLQWSFGHWVVRVRSDSDIVLK